MEQHFCGYTELVPKGSGGNSKAVTGQQSTNHRYIERENYVDKQTGAYEKASYKENTSYGDVYKERSSGRVGYKDEVTRTSTYQYGDKTGYAEYQVEERFRVVDYGNSSGSRGKNSSGNKYLK